MIINIWAGPHCHNTFVASQLMKMSNLEYISAWFSILIFVLYSYTPIVLLGGR